MTQIPFSFFSLVRRTLHSCSAGCRNSASKTPKLNDFDRHTPIAAPRWLFLSPLYGVSWIARYYGNEFNVCAEKLECRQSTRRIQGRCWNVATGSTAACMRCHQPFSFFPMPRRSINVTEYSGVHRPDFFLHNGIVRAWKNLNKKK